jgi:hypothetical protein
MDILTLFFGSFLLLTVTPVSKGRHILSWCHDTTQSMSLKKTSTSPTGLVRTPTSTILPKATQLERKPTSGSMPHAGGGPRSQPRGMKEKKASGMSFIGKLQPKMSFMGASTKNLTALPGTLLKGVKLSSFLIKVNAHPMLCRHLPCTHILHSWTSFLVLPLIGLGCVYRIKCCLC